MADVQSETRLIVMETMEVVLNKIKEEVQNIVQYEMGLVRKEIKELRDILANESLQRKKLEKTDNTPIVLSESEPLKEIWGTEKEQVGNNEPKKTNANEQSQNNETVTGKTIKDQTENLVTEQTTESRTRVPTRQKVKDVSNKVDVLEEFVRTNGQTILNHEIEIKTLGDAVGHFSSLLVEKIDREETEVIDDEGTVTRNASGTSADGNLEPEDDKMMSSNVQVELTEVSIKESKELNEQNKLKQLKRQEKLENVKEIQLKEKLEQNEDTSQKEWIDQKDDKMKDFNAQLDLKETPWLKDILGNESHQRKKVEKAENTTRVLSLLSKKESKVLNEQKELKQPKKQEKLENVKELQLKEKLEKKEDTSQKEWIDQKNQICQKEQIDQKEEIESKDLNVENFKDQKVLQLKLDSNICRSLNLREEKEINEEELSKPKRSLEAIKEEELRKLKVSLEALHEEDLRKLNDTLEVIEQSNQTLQKRKLEQNAAIEHNATKIENISERKELILVKKEELKELIVQIKLNELKLNEVKEQKGQNKAKKNLLIDNLLKEQKVLEKLKKLQLDKLNQLIEEYEDTIENNYHEYGHATDPKEDGLKTEEEKEGDLIKKRNIEDEDTTTRKKYELEKEPGNSQNYLTIKKLEKEKEPTRDDVSYFQKKFDMYQTWGKITGDEEEVLVDSHELTNGKWRHGVDQRKQLSREDTTEEQNKMCDENPCLMKKRFGPLEFSIAFSPDRENRKIVVRDESNYDYYTFKAAAPMKDVITGITRERRKYYQLGEVFFALKNFIIDNEFYDKANPEMIVCVGPLALAFGTTLVHTSQVRAIVITQMDKVTVETMKDEPIGWLFTENVGDNDKAMESFKSCQQLKGGSKSYPLTDMGANVLKKIRKTEHFVSGDIEDESLFTLTPEFQKLIQDTNVKDVKGLNSNKTVFSYDDLRKLLYKHMANSKEIVIPEGNPQVALIHGDPLAEVFGANTLHLHQLPFFLREHLLPPPPKEEGEEAGKKKKGGKKKKKKSGRH